MRITNRRAYHDYHILETLEAGLVLTGPEVKSLREGRADMTGSFARVQNDEVYMKNVFIPPYNAASLPDYDPKRDRKLLLHRKQIESLIGKTAKASVTLIPLTIYEKRNMMKVQLALAASKKKFDKRRAIKAKDEQRKIEQDLRGYKDNDLRKE